MSSDFRNSQTDTTPLKFNIVRSIETGNSNKPGLHAQIKTRVTDYINYRGVADERYAYINVCVENRGTGEELNKEFPNSRGVADEISTLVNDYVKQIGLAEQMNVGVTVDIAGCGEDRDARS